MPKVLFIDDEPYVIEGLRTMVDWATYGFEICGHATNGQDGLELLLTHQPELVITDIRMPGMSGLEVLKQARRAGCARMNFIILSGYDDFTYIQDAMRYGVSAYLLKPLDEEEIQEALTGVGARINLQNWEAGPDSLFFEANIDQEVRCILLEINQETQWRSESTTAEEEIKQALMESLPRTASYHFFAVNPQRYCLFLAEKAYQTGRIKRSIHEYVESLQELLKKHCRSSVSLAISGQRRGYKSLADLYKQAAMAMNYKYLMGDGGTVYFTDIKHNLLNYDYCQEYIESLLEEIKKNRPTGIEERVNSLFQSFARNRYAIEVAQACIKNLELEVLKLILKLDVEIQEVSQRFTEFHQKMASITGERLKSEVTAFCLDLAEYIGSSEQNKVDSIIGEITDFIKENYDQDLNLQKLAERFYISPVYLGQLFKKSTGLRFCDYLHRIRIDEAKKMLRRTDMKVAEIARTIGYRDPDYFVRKFKSITRISPSTFKNLGK
ncbi:MAG TPA: response regulator [Firmicutes bacterium]|nr:response regulator [Bacillota bacterium]